MDGKERRQRSMADQINFGILGTTVVHRQDGTMEQFPAKTSQVLALLLTSLGQVVPSIRIVRSIWGENPPTSARSMVREHIKKIRDGLAEAGPAALVAGYGGYRLERDAAVVDAQVFESLVRQGRQHHLAGDLTGAEQHFLGALALWRDVEALTDVREVMELEAEAVRLEEHRFHSEQALIECYLASGRADQAIPHLRMLTVRHPTRERFWALLMAAQSALGRRPEASATYRIARRAYVEETGIFWSAELDAMHERILRGERSEDIIRKVCPAASFRV